MASPAHAGAVTALRADDEAAPSATAFSSILQSANVEFLSTLQLLAERACFLTDADGVGIAIKENEEFVYRAAAGKLFETGTRCDISKAPIAKCLATAKSSLVSAHTSQGHSVKVAVPITADGEAIGLLELHASRAEFSDADLRALSGLAEMVGTALEHLRAAEGAHAHIVQNTHASAAEPVAPLSWHAETTSEGASKQDAPPNSTSEPVKVHTCHSCGFPISDNRQLCVECERKPDAPRPPAPQLLASDSDPGFIENHGFTIASLLISALVIAIIYWLR
jgi:GAF domain